MLSHVSTVVIITIKKICDANNVIRHCNFEQNLFSKLIQCLFKIIYQEAFTSQPQQGTTVLNSGKKSTYHLSGSTQQPLQAQAHFLNCGKSNSLLRANGKPLKWKSSHFQHYKDKTNTCLSHHTIKELTPYTFNITKH